MKAHKDKDKVKSVVCTAEISKGWLSRHMKSHEEGAKEWFSCDKCEFKTDFRSNLKSHKCQDCSICGVRVQSHSAMKSTHGQGTLHSQAKESSNSSIEYEYKCNDCSKTSNDWGNIQKHIKSAEQGQDW